jgi:cell division protease FtsH
MAKALLDWETIDSEQIDDIMAGGQPRPPKDWSPQAKSGGGGDSPPSVTTGGAPAAA